MKIHVDYGRCEGHGMCVTTAPDVFALDDDGVVQYAFDGHEVPAAQMKEAQFAADTCPVAALRVE